MTARERFAIWVTWLGVSEAEVARKLGCDESYPRKVRLGLRRPGTDVGAAIERETAAPRNDGALWPDGPIKATDWATTHAPSVEQGEPVEESAS